MLKLHFGLFASFCNLLSHLIIKSLTFIWARIKLYAFTFNLLDVEWIQLKLANTNQITAPEETYPFRTVTVGNLLMCICHLRSTLQWNTSPGPEEWARRLLLPAVGCWEQVSVSGEINNIYTGIPQSSQWAAQFQRLLVGIWDWLKLVLYFNKVCGFYMKNSGASKASISHVWFPYLIQHLIIVFFH